MRYLLILVLLALSGCSFINNINRQVDIVDRRASLSGTVINQSGRDGPIRAILLQSDGRVIRWMNEYHVSANGAYKFFAVPGNYNVAAFVDLNRDGDYQANEPATYLGEKQKIPSTVSLLENQDQQLENLVINNRLTPRVSTQVVYQTPKALDNIGRVVSLEDRMFSRENASLGLWQPFDFAQQVGGGMFLLDDFHKGKIPVVFVHGLSGTPTDWEEPIKALDRDRFQPLLFHFPSGLPVELTSEFFLRAINELQSRHQFPEFYVAAHSMGGLVTRAFVKRYVASGNQARIGLVMTVNSPMKGMKSAQFGVKFFPIVIPAWRDVAYESEFVARLLAWPWPRDIPYHLVFSHLPGKDGDGVVNLESQIPRSLQKDATAMHGFQGGHAKLLRDPEFVVEFKDILSNSLQ